jgi:zinc transporter ZupT
MESTKLGVTVAFGIMIHNIPEGIAIALPCLAA